MNTKTVLKGACWILTGFVVFSVVQADDLFPARVTKKKLEAKCEYLFVQAPAGWVIKKLKLQIKDHSRKRIVEGGEAYSYVLLRDGHEEGTTANIIFGPKNRNEQIKYKWRLTANVHKENCYFGESKNQVTQKLGDSLTPAKVLVTMRNATSQHKGKVTYTFEAPSE